MLREEIEKKILYLKKNKKTLPRSTHVNLSNQTNNLSYEIKIIS